MCIMEIHPGQLASTMVQACAHNISTVDRDIDMFKTVLTARGRTELLAAVEEAHVTIAEAYGKLLTCFADEVQREVAEHGPLAHPDHQHDSHGAEKVAHIHPVDREMIEDHVDEWHFSPEMIEHALHAARQAEKFETR